MINRTTSRMNILPLFLALVLVFSQILSAFVPVSAQADIQADTVTLVEWDFNQDTPLATGGIEGNLNEEFSIAGASPTGYVLGSQSGSRALNSNGWNSAEESYWFVQFTTEGYEDIRFSSKHRGSNTGPKDFTVEYSLDGETWTSVPGADFEVGNDWTTGILNQISVPTEVNDQETVFLRWLNTSDVSINGGTVGGAGTNRVDDVIIEAAPLDEAGAPGETPDPEVPGDEDCPTYTSISDARAMSGEEVTVIGVANIDQGLLHRNNFSLYIQDEAAGIQLFSFDANDFPSVKEGDLVKATGTVGEFNQVTQLAVTDVEVLERNQEVSAKNIDLSTYMDASLAESYEGQLVQFEGYIRNINDYFNGGVTISIINDDFDAVDIRIWESTGFDLSELEEHTWYEVTAISSQFNTTYQVLPRSNADFVKLAEQRDEPTTLNREYEAVVANVTDGDTIRLATPILGATNVRFLNMDTPETYHAVHNELDENQMRHGDNATAHMQTMLSVGDTVTIRLGEEPLDSFGRLLAEVITLDGVNTNLEMVRAGYASTYFIYPFEDDTVEEYAEAAKYARENQLGIYNPEDPLLEEPFVFRARERGDTGLSRYVGNFKTKEYVAPDHYAIIEPEYRVFFTRAQAEHLGYTPLEMTDQEVIDMDKNALGIGFQGSDSAANVTQDVMLETTGSYGSVITWESSNEEVISPTGEVTNPLYEGVSVTLTATLQKGELVETKEFVLTVNPEIVELVSWHFDGESEVATGGIEANTGVTIETVGSDITGYVAGHGSNSRAVNANGWTEGSYWVVDISTLGYKNITLSSRQFGSNTGPRDFEVQYSLDGENWSVVPGGEVVVANNWNSGVIDQLALPAEVENNESVLIRWLNTSDVAINGNTVGTFGTNRIDNIVFTGNEGLFIEEPEVDPIVEEINAGGTVTVPVVDGTATQSFTADQLVNVTELPLETAGVKLTIPVSTLDSSKDVTVSWTENNDALPHADQALSNIFTFNVWQDGEKITSFTEPISIAFKLNADVDTSKDIKIFYFNGTEWVSEDAHGHEYGGTLSDDGQFIVGSTTHFSTFALFAVASLEDEGGTEEDGPEQEDPSQENGDNDVPDTGNGESPEQDGDQAPGQEGEDAPEQGDTTEGGQQDPEQGTTPNNDEETAGTDVTVEEQSTEETDETLPATATNMYNMILIGLLLMTIGYTTITIRKKQLS
ncbi:immunoglobulin-like domain-containing protein [Evansella cellulosilytica]|uniref:LPXTG-motif cell wall anchor domain protein n=1 Tax=Evansella cellulosilytica (strain ATCC 21833 / DSM 2522 / FERM P-1141 / JCM 9156 / N-4) TaxID=649639 RepID=E6TUQ7_EVAC2|nr:immunoglobulin-like domain-containing protein [Evansella cellulosilytica]ADU32059.1 LPXTG-motif cell wall anchor domain protein [Evansella cellulosilytica DSM 2522]